MPQFPRTYLGDSVYADYDGFSLILTTRNDDGPPLNEIVMEPSVIKAFNLYCQSVAQVIREEVEAKRPRPG